MIELKKVSKSFHAKRNNAVHQVSFTVDTGEILVLLGSSGSGKTTVLKLMNRLIEPSSGEILLQQKNIATLDPVQLRRSIGYVFQGIGLFPHMTVEENIAIVLRLNGIPEDLRLKKAWELLELVNLDPHTFSKRFPNELSGGQQQRIGVARSLAFDAELLLMDEPFGALDALNRQILQDELLTLKQKLNKTIVFVTHDIFEALRLGDRIAVMNQGKLEQIGTKEEIIQDPKTPFVKALFEQSRLQLQEMIGEYNS